MFVTMLSYRNEFLVALVSSFWFNFVFPLLCACLVCCVWRVYRVQYRRFSFRFGNSNGYKYIFVCLPCISCPIPLVYMISSTPYRLDNQYFVCLCLICWLFVASSSRFATSFLQPLPKHKYIHIFSISVAIFIVIFATLNETEIYTFFASNTIAVVHYCLQYVLFGIRLPCLQLFVSHTTFNLCFVSTTVAQKQTPLLTHHEE